METTRTAICVGCPGGVYVVELFSGGIRIAYVAVRQITKTQAEMTEEAEAGDDILEVSVLGVLLHAILAEIGQLPRQTSIEDE